MTALTGAGTQRTSANGALRGGEQPRGGADPFDETSRSNGPVAALHPFPCRAPAELQPVARCAHGDELGEERRRTNRWGPSRCWRSQTSSPGAPTWERRPLGTCCRNLTRAARNCMRAGAGRRTCRATSPAATPVSIGRRARNIPERLRPTGQRARPESEALRSLLSTVRPDVVLSLHNADTGGAFLITG